MRLWHFGLSVGIRLWHRWLSVEIRLWHRWLRVGIRLWHRWLSTEESSPLIDKPDRPFPRPTDFSALVVWLRAANNNDGDGYLRGLVDVVTLSICSVTLLCYYYLQRVFPKITHVSFNNSLSLSLSLSLCLCVCLCLSLSLSSGGAKQCHKRLFQMTLDGQADRARRVFASPMRVWVTAE